MKSIVKATILAMIVFAIAIATGESFGQATVQVSDAYSAIHYSGTIQLKQRSVESFDLPWNEFGDAYTVRVNTHGSGISLFVIDGRDAATKNPNPRLLFNQVVMGQKTIEVGKPASREGLILVLRNNGSESASVDMLIHRTGKRTPKVTAPIKELISLPIDVLDRFYFLPKLTVTVRPCGEVNAFSQPNIVICTELMADLFAKGVPNALLPILLHELAHSLLDAWGLPGYDNEDMADEFAAMFLAQAVPDSVSDLIRWLELQDSISEAAVQLVRGGRHSLSIQRARNMKKVIEQPDALISRWEKLLAPFIRR